ncbi:MAG: selenium-dependent molybdenum cofactor biosynthesis protein YqeB [bacterium]
MSSTGSREPWPGPIIAIKGSGEMASAIAWRLFRANLRRIYLMDLPQPLTIRRGVAFCDALFEGEKTVEGVVAVKARDAREIKAAWTSHRIPVLVDPQWRSLASLPPGVVVDAILAKRNLGTRMEEAPVVVALGPGFVAGRDAHLVIETNRGHDLGRIITEGSATPDTGVPAEVGGHTVDRVLRAPVAGVFQAVREIGDRVAAGENLGHVDGQAVETAIAGTVRGLIRSGTRVEYGLKLADIEVRHGASFCDTISDKARAISGSVLESILHKIPWNDTGDAKPSRKPRS